MAPQFSVNLDGTINTNDNHFDNHFFLKTEEAPQATAKKTKCVHPGKDPKCGDCPDRNKVTSDHTINKAEEVPEIIKTIVVEEQEKEEPIFDELLPEEGKHHDVWKDPSPALMKNLENMRKFSERYAMNTKTKFCVDPEVTAAVLKGLANHKTQLGAPLCPCRHYDDPVAEVKDGYWNCPCEPMRKEGECHCMLFLQPDNSFADEGEAKITSEFILSCE